MERAVHTTPPIIIDATMPDVPEMPTATKIADATMRVMSVIPLTGLVPTIAMALAATVVKRNAMSVTTTHATSACQKLWSTPAQKNAKTATSAIAMKNTMCFMEMSRCQRGVRSDEGAPEPNSRRASPAACTMIPQDLMIPITPAMAMPPMPIRRA